MSAIDVDPKTLEIGAAASAHAFEQAIVHIGEEIRARDPQKLDALVGSFAPVGPYAYTILPEVGADGSVKLPVLTTREEITGAYGFIRGLSDLHEVIGLTEIRGAWYLFQDNITLGGPKGSEQLNNRQTLALFPSGAGPGITGELVWLRVPRARLGAPDEVDVIDEDPLLARRQVFDQYARYLDGLRANDVDAVLATLHDGVASAVRDYVDDTGTLVELSGRRRAPLVVPGAVREVRDPVRPAALPGDRGLVRVRRAAHHRGAAERDRYGRLPYCGVPHTGQGRTVHRPHRSRHGAGVTMSDTSLFPRAQAAIAGIGCTEYSRDSGVSVFNARGASGQGGGRGCRASLSKTSTASARTASTTRSRRTSWRRRSASRA